MSQIWGRAFTEHSAVLNDTAGHCSQLSDVAATTVLIERVVHSVALDPDYEELRKSSIANLNATRLALGDVRALLDSGRRFSRTIR